MSPRLHAGLALAAAGLIAPAASPAAESGGAAAPRAVKVSAAVCATGEAWSCEQGKRLRLNGDGMDGVQRVVFLGGSGHADDRAARPLRAAARQVTVVVPASARTGRVVVESVMGSARAPRPIAIAAARARTKVSASHAGGAEVGEPGAAGDGTFPIKGRHDMGQTATNGFGGGRGHKGQDMFAACGTPLVAVRDATVQDAKYQDRAGNYVVLQDASGRSYGYMHMKAAALVRTGQRVTQGQRVGYVGESGRASGCHLHFELWTAPGWYTGGQAIDPLPQLRAWHRDDGDH